MQTSKSIHVLIVDDSALMRRMISDFVTDESDMQVIGFARNGDEALERAAALVPDVVTLDVQMPGKDGLATLSSLLNATPVPVLMVSALTERGAETTLQSLDLGAVDYVAKPDSVGDRPRFQRDVVAKIRAIQGTDVQRLKSIRAARAERISPLRRASPRPQVPAGYKSACIALGISTGGPPALTGLFQELGMPTPPIVVVQHMPPKFTGPFAKRLDSLSPLHIKEAESGDRLEPNCVYVAPGARHLAVESGRGQPVLRVFDDEPVSSHKPSVDVMMQSVAEVFGARALGIIMTGMGTDGVAGCQAIQHAGGYVLGQDQATSDVYGMNKAAHQQGFVNAQFALENLHTLISTHCQQSFR